MNLLYPRQSFRWIVIVVKHKTKNIKSLLKFSNIVIGILNIIVFVLEVVDDEIEREGIYKKLNSSTNKHQVSNTLALVLCSWELHFEAMMILKLYHICFWEFCKLYRMQRRVTRERERSHALHIWTLNANMTMDTYLCYVQHLCTTYIINQFNLRIVLSHLHYFICRGTYDFLLLQLFVNKCWLKQTML